MMRILLLFAFIFSLSLLPGCSKKEKENPTSLNSVLITVTHPIQQSVETTQETVGSLESIIEPSIAAEVSGRIEKVYVHPGDRVKKGQIMAKLDASDLLLAKQSHLAEAKRVEALYTNQGRTTQRYQDLLKEKYISQSMLEEAVAQEIALKEQWISAKAQLELTERDVLKSKIISPVNAVVESQLVSEGGYVRTGEPIFQIVTTTLLRAHLPFPESAANVLKPGLQVRLSTPTSTEVLEGRLLEIKPMTSTSRAIEAIVEVHNKGTWKPGSSVNAEVIIDRRLHAIVVPEQSVILRPSGSVVYVIQNGKALQKNVTTGISKAGFIEITSPLSVHDVIAVDGAGFLTDQALIKIHNG